jgi:two-component system response regulator PilR (NtrC family)
LAGNVRELENLLHRAVALGDGTSLQFEPPNWSQASTRQGTEITPSLAEPETIPGDLQQYLDELERSILSRALQATDFNRTAAATRLGLSLRQMRYRIARLRIDLPHLDDPVVASD